MMPDQILMSPSGIVLPDSLRLSTLRICDIRRLTKPMLHEN